MAKTPSGVLKVVAVDQYGIVVGRTSLVSILDTASRTPSNIAKVYLTDEYGKVSVLAIPTPENILMNAEGLVAQTFPRDTVSGTVALVSGSVYYTALPVLAGTVITNLSIGIQTAANTMTLGKLGLYSTSGSLLASTASQTTAWESTGIKTVALTSPYTVPSTGVIYAAVIAVASTGPTLYRGGSGSSPLMAAIGSGIKPFSIQTGQTDLPSPGTPSASGSAAIWVGAS